MGYVSSQEGISESWAHTKKKERPLSGKAQWSEKSEFQCLSSVISAFSWSSLCSALHRSSRWAWETKNSRKWKMMTENKQEQHWQHCDLEMFSQVPTRATKTFSAFNSSCRRISCSALRMITFLDRFETCHVVVAISYTTDVSITLSIWDV